MNLKISAAGFAIQDAKGAAAAQPDYWGPVGAGKLVGVELEQTEDELTSARVAGVGEFRESVAITAGYETRLWPGSFAGLLYAVLGARQTTGAAAPYTHTLTPAALLPWCTVFGAKDTERKSASDAKADSLKVEWEGNGPVKATIAWAGLGVAWSDAAYVPVTDETDDTYLKGINLTSVIDLDGSGYDGGAVLQGGSVEVKRNITPDPKSGQLAPADLSEGAFECDVEFKVRVPDLLPVRKLLTGAVDGSTIAAAVPYGGFTLTFADAAESVALAAAKVAFKVPEEPEADPKGGPAELTLQGRCYGEPAITATVINSVASY
ncbi:MAG: hypothetical protein QM323_04185 [Acidobacteriota bacterium]|nr:hypothetical protein [Acidobacteriota bacterium]